MKYGIRHNNGEILAISKFEGDVDPRFTEITKAKYDEFITHLETNPFASYDDVKNELSLDAIALTNAENQRDKNVLRQQLKELSIELDLRVRLSEPTAATQAEFDALKLQYEAL